MSDVLTRKKLEKIELLKAKKTREAELPHLYGQKWYSWAWDFFTTKNKMVLLTAGNQLSKSSTQIRKVIHLATAMQDWDKWWPTRPKQFWYLYPSKEVATIEFYEKWVPEFMPRGGMLTDPQYGWVADFDATKKIRAVFFNSGVTIYFKSYEQNTENLQTGTAHYIACDEELDASLYNELKFRTAAVDGYFSMVFTATKGQEFWRLAMEPFKGEQEMFPEAWKRTVSMYDCQYYKDGTPSRWTDQRIKEVVSTCSSQAEIDKRVMGKFVLSDKLAFPWYKPTLHHVQNTPTLSVPADWEIHSAVDLGSGALSMTSHPAAIVFLGINPEKTRVRCFRAWRGDRIKTAAGDVYEQFKQMQTTIGREPVIKSYDYESADFGIITERAGDFWYRAEKSVARGQELVNSMFKYNVLTLDQGDPEIEKLSTELQSVAVDGGKDQRDDLVSALRYGCMKLALDWNKIREMVGEKEENSRQEVKTEETSARRTFWSGKDDNNGFTEGVEEEMAFWNELIG